MHVCSAPKINNSLQSNWIRKLPALPFRQLINLCAFHNHFFRIELEQAILWKNWFSNNFGSKGDQEPCDFPLVHTNFVSLRAIFNSGFSLFLVWPSFGTRMQIVRHWTESQSNKHLTSRDLWSRNNLATIKCDKQSNILHESNVVKYRLCWEWLSSGRK